MLRRVPGLFVALLVSGWVHAAEVRVEIEGIDGELLENARAALDLASYQEREVTAAQIRLLYQSAPEQIRKALQPYGYYDASVQGELRQPDPGQFVAAFEVDRGPPVIVRDVQAEVRGPASEIPEVRAALRQFEPRQGERFQAASYEKSKDKVSAQLRAKGFLDARTVEHRVAVTLETRSADVDVVWESGERFRFGAVHFSESPLDLDFLRGYVPWRRGDPYSADSIVELQRRLTEADYFSVVSVRPQLRQAKDREVPIEVMLVENERSLYAAGLYVNTDAGAGGRLSAERRWLNRFGHKAEGTLEYSQRLQEASANYRILQPGPFRRDYLFGAAYRDEETRSSRARMTSFGTAEARERWHGFNRTLGFKYLDSDFEVGRQQLSSSLLYGEAVLTRRIVDDVLYPRNSYGVTFGLRASPGGALSDTDFVRFDVQGKWIRGSASRHRVLLRADLGALTVGEFDTLPPELRFFAGGDRSVRGFDYEAIGERRGDDGVIGGKYLAVASVEYDYFIWGDWGAAAFVDAGDAFTSDFTMHVGAGLGVRWRSPVGMVRLDVAKPIAGPMGEGWRIHFVMGPDL